MYLAACSVGHLESLKAVWLPGNYLHTFQIRRRLQCEREESGNAEEISLNIEIPGMSPGGEAGDGVMADHFRNYRCSRGSSGRSCS